MLGKNKPFVPAMSLYVHTYVLSRIIHDWFSFCPYCRSKARLGKQCGL